MFLPKNLPTKTASLILAIFIICFLSIFYVFASWQGPTSNPAGNNIPAPINKGDIDQEKGAGVGATTFYDKENASYYFDPAGSSFLNGPVGIGISPTLNAGDLQVARALNMVGGAGSYFKLPSLSESEKQALTPADGFMIYNSNGDTVQIYSAGAWHNLEGIPAP